MAAASPLSFRPVPAVESLKPALEQLLATAGDRPAAAAAFVDQHCHHLHALSPPTELAATLLAVLSTSDKKRASQREVALHLTCALLAKHGLVAAPFLVPVLPALLTLAADKHSRPVQAAATAAAAHLVRVLPPVAKRALCVAPLVDALSIQAKWQTQAGALAIIRTLATDAPHEIGSCMPDLVPAVAPLMCEAKPALSDGSNAAMSDMCRCIDNPDVKPLVPHLMAALGNPAKVEHAIHKLAATTFVAQVECNALAITVPLLKRAFQTRSTPLKRISAKIISNMAKLVERPSDVQPFIPTLMPALKRAAQEISDPEARSVCADAVDVLDAASKGEGMAPEPPRVEKSTVLQTLKDSCGAAAAAQDDPAFDIALDFVAEEATVLIANQALDFV